MMNLYIADLQAYNNGELKGKWITLPMCEVELENILDSFPSDYAIHDYESEIEVSEYMNIEQLNEFTHMMEDNKYNMEMLDMVDNWQTYEIDELRYKLEDINVHYYCGDTSHYVLEHELKQDFAQWYMTETGQYNEDLIPSEIRYAINWDRVADQLEHSFTLKQSSENGKLYWKSRY